MNQDTSGSPGQPLDSQGNGAGKPPLGPTPIRARFFVPIAVLVVLALLPVIALGTPPGQRLVERLIEAPLLARLIASAPEPFVLHVDQLETKVGGATIQVELIGAALTAPGIELELDQTRVRLRYADILRGNPIPDRIEVQSARLRVDDLQPMRSFQPQVEQAPDGLFGDADVATVDDFETLGEAATNSSTTADGVATVATPEMLASLRLDGLVNAFDALDQALTQVTVGDTWQSLKSITINQLALAPQPEASIPFLRDPDIFQLNLSRQSPSEMLARIETTDRLTPISLIVRHAEGNAPEGPAELARRAGTEIGPEDAYSHLLLYGLNVSDLTSALGRDEPVAFESSLAAEIVVTRAADSSQVDQILALFESDAGYLVASQSEATILEFASIPMVYTRHSGRFDIVSARVEFQETGGVFNGHLEPRIRNGRQGLRLALNAPSYRVAVPPEPLLGRELQRATADVSLEVFVSDSGDLIELPIATVRLGNAQVAYSGLAEQTSDGTVVSLVGQSTPMNVSQLAALWPLPLSPEGRSWFLQNIAEGQLDIGTFSFVGNLDDIAVEDGRTILSDDMLNLSVPYENLVMRTVGELPPVFGLDGTIEVTGRTLRMVGSDGIGRLNTGEMIQVPSAEFFIGDHSVEIPDAWLELELTGPASGFAHMALMDPIELDDILPFSPTALTGDVSLTARIEAELSKDLDRDEVLVESELQVTDFSSTEPVEGRSLTDGAFRITSGAFGTQLVGRARLDGVLTELNLSPDDGENIQLAMRLGEADRERIGLDFGRYLTGSVGVDLQPTSEPGRQRMVIDLTDANLEIAELGYSKPSGRQASASFDLIERGDQRLVRNLVLSAQGLSARGSLDFVGSDLRVAEFESVAIDGVGRFSLDLTRNSQTLSARLSGERFVLKPELLNGDPDAAGALSVQIDVAELVTQGGETLNDVQLVYAQDAQRITNFELRARHSDGTDLAGTLANQSSRQSIVISSGNAGTFLRFLGLYERAHGGRATLVLDPSSVGGRVAGQLLLSDYEIRNEPAMESIFSSGSQQARDGSGMVLPGRFETSDRIEIEVTNISFDRTADRLIIHNAEGWGPSLGGNIEGTIDYAANRIAMDGTYVPFFSINNIFSRIPIIGQALGGRETEGLLGVTFQLVGTADSPRLEVNPMSLLAPGVIRNIFEYQQGG